MTVQPLAQRADHSARPQRNRLPFSLGQPVLPLRQLRTGGPSGAPATPPPVMLTLQLTLLPPHSHPALPPACLSIFSLSPAAHHAGPSPAFGMNPPFPLISTLACAFPQPPLKVPTTPTAGLRPCSWLGSWPLSLSLLGLGILATSLATSPRKAQNRVGTWIQLGF